MYAYGLCTFSLSLYRLKELFLVASSSLSTASHIDEHVFEMANDRLKKAANMPSFVAVQPGNKNKQKNVK